MCYPTISKNDLHWDQNLSMKKVFFSALLSVAAFMANGCASVQMAPSEPMGPDIYRLSARATSRKSLTETVKSANDRCAQENKQYLFVKNIFQHNRNLGVDRVSYVLYFTCVDAGDPRLKERKSILRPAEEKTNQKVSPDKEKPPAQGAVDPVPEPAEAKPTVSPDKKTAPTPDMLPQPQPKDEKQGQEEAAKVSKEQPRKKITEPGELEDLRKDGAALYDDSEQDSPIIEEILPEEISESEKQRVWRRMKRPPKKQKKQQTKSAQ